MELLSQIALAMTPGLGPTQLRRLVACFPGQDIFSLPPTELRAAFGTHVAVAESIISRAAFPRAEEELRYCERHNIRPLFFTQPEFPTRLNREECYDSPALLYVLGAADLNAERTVSIVGTRRATAVGRDNTHDIVRQLQPLSPTIVSGLAYGIDTAAHQAALQQSLPTVAVLGHGLDRIYPPANRQLAADIVSAGGALVTEYPSGTAIKAGQFPARNRIIAALGDCTLVVEAKEKGGALITAAIANSYCRDVFAVPGRLTDTYSRGTNSLIATNKAILLRSAADLAYQLGWPIPGQPAVQQQMFPVFTPEEQTVVNLLQLNATLTLDELSVLSQYTMTHVAGVLFSLEMSKVVRQLPGHRYELVKA